MANNFTYKGYVGKFEYLEGDEQIHGKVLGIQDMIHFSGSSLSELRQDFQEAVDDYLEWCKAENRAPEKPFTGNFVVRIPPELHREASVLAEAEDESLNSWVVGVIKQAIEWSLKEQPHAHL
jgi:predicted HicB family RNase H-like nuclease